MYQEEKTGQCSEEHGGWGWASIPLFSVTRQPIKSRPLAEIELAVLESQVEAWRNLASHSHLQRRSLILKDLWEFWASLLSGKEQTEQGKNLCDRTKGETLDGWTIHRLLCALPQCIKDSTHNPKLTFSLSVLSFFVTMGKKYYKKRLGKTLGHEITENSPVPHPRETSELLRLRAGSGNTKKGDVLDCISLLLEVCA